MPVKNGIQLITYADSLGGNLSSLDNLLKVHFMGLFKGGVHILPPFPSSSDRGFAPKTYYEIDPDFGTWNDITAIGERHDVILDLMVNHISRQSEYFQDFVKLGHDSRWADLFITIDKVWPDSQIPQDELAMIACRKPESPFSDILIEGSGRVERLWSSFGSRNWSEQMDLDVQSPSTRQLFKDILEHFARHGIKILRLDAVGYVIKKRGTSCFYVEPEIHEFLDWIRSIADGLGIELLLEIHAHRDILMKLAAKGYHVYDFALPALLLHSFQSASSSKLRDHLLSSPRNQFTMLDCHDGIPIWPDLEGILSAAEIGQVVNACLAHGANLSQVRTGRKANDVLDTHQVNCTYLDALGRDADAYIAARAIQFFVPGVPQVYYVGLLAGENDYEAVEATGVGRAINRHNFSLSEIDAALEKSTVKRLLVLIRLRNEHLAFNGSFSLEESGKSSIVMKWQNGEAFCVLEVNFLAKSANIRFTGENGGIKNLRP